MILLIDGYNVLKQAIARVEISDFERDLFIKKLGRYGKIRGHDIRLVFDSGPSYLGTKESFGSVVVVYSGAKETADDYIKRYIDKHKSLDILLVSSDRDICRHASRLNVEQIDSKDFYDIFSRVLQENSTEIVSEKLSVNKAVKISEEDNPELDMIMQEGSKIVKKKLDDIALIDDLIGILSKNKLKKKEISKIKKIKKL